MVLNLKNPKSPPQGVGIFPRGVGILEKIMAPGVGISDFFLAPGYPIPTPARGVRGGADKILNGA